MPLVKSGSRAGITANIREMIASGHPRSQAVAAALSVADRYSKRAAGGRAAGGSSPPPQTQALTTAAPNVNASGFAPVPQPGAFNLDLSTGALTASSQQNLQNLAQRGLTIAGAQPPASAATAAPAASLLGTPGVPLTPEQQAAQLTANFGPSFANANPVGGGGGSGGNARGGRLAAGGPTPSEMASTFGREAGEMGATHPGGLVGGLTAGRADKVPMSVAAGSHVIPADVMSGLGDGNSLAGAHAMDLAMNSGPGGIKLPRGPHRGMGMPAARTAPPRTAFAKGGPVYQGHTLRLASGGVPTGGGGVRCLLSDGEYLLKPDEVRRIEHNGKKGHDAIDNWIVERRAENVKKQRSLPKPVGMKG